MNIHGAVVKILWQISEQSSELIKTKCNKSTKGMERCANVSLYLISWMAVCWVMLVSGSLRKPTGQLKAVKRELIEHESLTYSYLKVWMNLWVCSLLAQLPPQPLPVLVHYDANYFRNRENISHFVSSLMIAQTGSLITEIPFRENDFVAVFKSVCSFSASTAQFAAIKRK